MSSYDGDRNTEIWSTRLQRELLAMTTNNATEEAHEEMTATLPPFCTVQDHQLDIERGNCTVMCWVDLPPSSTSPAAVDAVNQTTNVSATTPTGTTADGETKEEGTDDDEDDKKDEAEAESSEEKKTATESSVPAASASEEAAPIIITLDVSLQKKSDGTVDTMAVSYPFLKPVAILTSGCDRFPAGSTIQDGDLVAIEMDWTPSLHLTDAFLNISLKIKECLSQNEPFHPEVMDKSSADTVTEMMSRAKKLGASVSESLRGLGAAASGDDAGDGKKKGSRMSSLIGRGGKKKEKKKEKPKAKTPSEVRTGDEINMLEAPWVDCQGVYSCKSIRRPKFVEEAVAAAEKELKKDPEPKVSQSLLDEDVDQGEVPDDFGEYMRVQAGGLSQVCPGSELSFQNPCRLNITRLTLFFLSLRNYLGRYCKPCGSWSHVQIPYQISSHCFGGVLSHDHRYAHY